jgi:hypothetical protein
MKAKFGKRVAMLLASTALCAAGTLTVGAGAAHAAVPNFTFTFVHSESNPNYYYIYIYNDGTLAGFAEFSADPTNGDPGDAIRAADLLADGYGIKAELSVPSPTTPGMIRTASTAGYNSPFYTLWQTGNLPEGHSYTMYGEAEKNGINYGIDQEFVYS